MTTLTAYCAGFAKAAEPWPSLPLTQAPELDWWLDLRPDRSSELLQGQALLAALQVALPQLRMPQVEGISGSAFYKASVLRGEHLMLHTAAPAGSMPPQWHQPEALRFWIAPHASGAVPVLLTANRHDFVQLVRALAHRAEPVPIGDDVHAQAVSGLVHWGLIERYGRQSRAQLIVLHEAPYGSVAAEHVPGGLSDQAWLEASTRLRLEHELTHLATKRLLGEMRLNLLDELIADCMGMLAALGRYDASLFMRCLGIDAEQQQLRPNGRWLSYTTALTPDDARSAVELVLVRSRELEGVLETHPHLLSQELAMQRLHWLCQQRLDQPISAAPPSCSSVSDQRG